jgi:hypothetical protein
MANVQVIVAVVVPGIGAMAFRVKTCPNPPAPDMFSPRKQTLGGVVVSPVKPGKAVPTTAVPINAPTVCAVRLHPWYAL